MKQVLLAVYFIFSGVSTFAQNGKIVGKVTDEKGEGVIQANVIIDASKGWAAVSDFDGNYTLSVPSGEYEIHYRYVGKEEVVKTVKVTEGETVTHNIVLVEKTRMIDQVVVSGSKYERKQSEETVSIEVMKGNTLQNQNVTDVAQGVQKIPGVTIADGQANIRGGAGWSYGAGSRVSVLFDDLAITTADADDAKWSVMPVENIEQIEVLKGAASAIYGSGALNGVINARLGYPTDKPYTKFQAYTGFYDSPPAAEMKWWVAKPQFFLGGQFADRRKVGQWDITTGLAYNNDRGYLDSSDSQDARLNMKVRYRFKKIQGLNVGLGILANWSWGKTFFIWDSIGDKGYRPMPKTITQYSNGRFLIDPFITYSTKNNDRFSLRYRLITSQNKNSTGQGSIADRHIIDFSYQRLFDVSEKAKLNFIAGVAGRVDRVAPPAGDTSYLYSETTTKHNANNASVYAQVDGKFFDRLNVTLGARWEYFNVDGKNSLKDLTYPLFRLGVNYQAAQATYIRASFGQGFRYPSIAEFFVNTRLGSISIFQNPNLKPEKGYSAEIGIKQGFKIGNNVVGYVDAAGFWNQYENMMEFMFAAFGKSTDPLAGAGFSSQNIGSARILGADAAIGAQATVRNVQFNLLVGYTFINTKSLNWDKPLTLFNSNGDTIRPNTGMFGLGQYAYNNANAPAGIDTATQITYGMLSSSNTNQLKYRPTHQLKLIFGIVHKKFDVTLDYQFIAYQKNIDYAFVSYFFTDIASTSLGGNVQSFKALKQYRDAKEAAGYKGDNIVNISVGYKPVEAFKIAFIIKNLANWEWMTRPGMFQAPRSYTLQLSYQF